MDLNEMASYLGRDITHLLSQLLVLAVLIWAILLVGAGLWGTDPAKNYLKWWRKATIHLVVGILTLPFKLLQWTVPARFKSKKKGKKKKKKK